VGTGTSEAYEVLGVCQKGGRVDFDINYHPIYSDLSGPMAPADRQQMGATARISMELAAVDEAVLAKVMKRALANAAGTDGTPGTPGALMGTGGHAHKLYLPSSTISPWVFDTVVLLRPETVEGTVAEPVKLVFEAWRYIPGTASSASSYKLYSRTTPP
jgi:hypothetical protein